jgi:hypothetical protein
MSTITCSLYCPNVISQRCAFGAIKKKFSNSILSGVVLFAK